MITKVVIAYNVLYIYFCILYISNTVKLLKITSDVSSIIPLFFKIYIKLATNVHFLYSYTIVK